jgi:hypothetical protein
MNQITHSSSAFQALPPATDLPPAFAGMEV